MNHTTTAGNLDLRTRATRPTGEWLAGAARLLGAFLSLRQATPEEVATRDVQAVRAMAESYRNTDPGFAGDLYAAACRHERTIEEAARSAS
jgi:hypothetical protein